MCERAAPYDRLAESGLKHTSLWLRAGCPQHEYLATVVVTGKMTPKAALDEAEIKANKALADAQ